MNFKENYKKAVQFLKEVKIELKKVSWPGRKETIVSTYVVIIVCFIIAIFLGIVDLGFSKILKIILR
jgi:preprotein translocase subunit SecE